MIQVGDKVRFSNEYLRSIGRQYGRRRCSSRRGKQRIMTVVRVNPTRWDWRSKTVNAVVEVDSLAGGISKSISTGWLKFVYRPKNRKVTGNLSSGDCKPLTRRRRARTSY